MRRTWPVPNARGAYWSNDLCDVDVTACCQPVDRAGRRRHYLVVGAVLFVCGALCMATKRNALGVLMGIELVLNGANLNFIAFGSPYLRSDARTRSGSTGS